MNKMNKIQFTALALLLTLSIGLVKAQGDNYIGLGLGQTTSDFIGGLSGQVDDEDTAWKLFYGLSLGERWGVEFHYSNLGEYSVVGDVGTLANGQIEYQSTGVSGILKGNVSPRIQLFGKAGFHFWNANMTGSFPGAHSDLEFTGDSGVDLFAGVGANYYLNSNNLFARIEYERFAMDGGDENVDLISASLIYQF